jgi:hypothetical protein
MTTVTGQLPRMRAVRALPAYGLEIQWETGGTTIVDLVETVLAGGVFVFLRDQVNFRRAKLGSRCRTVEWFDPKDPGAPVVDIDADTLMEMGQDQSFFRRLKRALGQQIA